MRRALALVVVLAASVAMGQATLTYPGQRPGGAAAGAALGVDLFVGDSITYGLTFDASPYPSRTAALTGRTAVNLGKGGDTAAGAYARWQAAGAGLAGVRWLVIEVCTNDIPQGTTGAACWATVQTWVEAAVAAGQRVAVWTVLPRGGWAGWSEEWEAERLAFNAAAHAYVTAHPSIRLVDADTFMADSSSPPRLLAEYDWGDGLHPRGAGFQAMAEAAAQVLR